MKKILVTYFSVPETTDPSNMTKDESNSVVVINGEVLGNTQYVARLIQENTKGDVFRIDRTTPYPVNHAVLLKEGKEEYDKGVRPELATTPENISQYDVIFVGFPNWYADMPMIIYTFLEKYDLAGKTIVPFVTHGGDGFSDTINTIAKLQPKATVENNGLSIPRNDADKCEKDVVAWLGDLKLIQ